MKNEQVMAVTPSATRTIGREDVEPESMTNSKRGFNDTFEEWLAVQAEMVDRIGVFGENLRPW